MFERNKIVIILISCLLLGLYASLSEARRIVAVPNYNPQAKTCADIYCHSNGKGNTRSIAWNSRSPMICEICHGYPPPSEHHRSISAQTGCQVCHPDTIANGYTTRFHIDGAVTAYPVDVSESTIEEEGCIVCHKEQQNGLRAIVPEFQFLSHHIQGEINSRGCAVCHLEEEDIYHGNKQIDLKNHQGGPSFVSLQYDEFCLSCHNIGESQLYGPFPFNDSQPIISIQNELIYRERGNSTFTNFWYSHNHLPLSSGPMQRSRIALSQGQMSVNDPSLMMMQGAAVSSPIAGSPIAGSPLAVPVVPTTPTIITPIAAGGALIPGATSIIPGVTGIMMAHQIGGGALPTAVVPPSATGGMALQALSPAAINPIQPGNMNQQVISLASPAPMGVGNQTGLPLNPAPVASLGMPMYNQNELLSPLSVMTPGISNRFSPTLPLSPLNMGYPLTPAMGNPGMGNLGVGNPGISNLGMGNPGMGNPAVGIPVIANPGMGNFGMGNPALGNPGMSYGVGAQMIAYQQTTPRIIPYSPGMYSSMNNNTMIPAYQPSLMQSSSQNQHMTTITGNPGNSGQNMGFTPPPPPGNGNNMQQSQMAHNPQGPEVSVTMPQGHNPQQQTMGNDFGAMTLPSPGHKEDEATTNDMHNDTTQYAHDDQATTDETTCLQCHSYSDPQLIPYAQITLNYNGHYSHTGCSQCHMPHGSYQPKLIRVGIVWDPLSRTCNVDTCHPIFMHQAPLETNGLSYEVIPNSSCNTTSCHN
ncbi:MAG: CxxxxCH/CxxCH domain c-type cytochrome [bacterium]